jgi:hypothetical protein
MSVTGTNAPTDIDEAEYLAAVDRCKAAIADITGKQWVLGDEAATVTKKYGENRLEQFAVDINFSGAACTLGRYRSVCLAFPKTGGRPRFFASAQILQRHDDRIQIVTANPNISVRVAREIMRQWRAEQPEEDQVEGDDPIEEEDDTAPTPVATTSTPAKEAKAKGAKKTMTEEQAEFNESKRLLSNQVELANELIGEAAGRKKCPAEQRRNLGKAAAMVPASLATMQKAGEEWLAYVDWLKELAAEAKETAIREGRIRTSPKPAPSEPSQVSA